MRRVKHDQHFWRVAAVWHPSSWLPGTNTTAVTYILWRCAGCTGPDSLTAQALPGVWTLADLASTGTYDVVMVDADASG